MQAEEILPGLFCVFFSFIFLGKEPTPDMKGIEAAPSHAMAVLIMFPIGCQLLHRSTAYVFQTWHGSLASGNAREFTPQIATTVSKCDVEFMLKLSLF